MGTNSVELDTHQKQGIRSVMEQDNHILLEADMHWLVAGALSLLDPGMHSEQTVGTHFLQVAGIRKALDKQQPVGMYLGMDRPSPDLSFPSGCRR